MGRKLLRMKLQSREREVEGGKEQVVRMTLKLDRLRTQLQELKEQAVERENRLRVELQDREKEVKEFREKLELVTCDLAKEQLVRLAEDFGRLEELCRQEKEGGEVVQREVSKLYGGKERWLGRRSRLRRSRVKGQGRKGARIGRVVNLRRDDSWCEQGGVGESKHEGMTLSGRQAGGRL